MRLRTFLLLRSLSSLTLWNAQGFVFRSASRSRAIPLALSSSETEKLALKSKSPSTAVTSSITTFTTEPMKVFIEDTDAYGVMYNANYLRSYDRALHMTSIDKNTGTPVLQHDGWSIVSMEQQKFKASPSLGGIFVIEGTLRASTEQQETWDMIMKSEDGSTIYNTVSGIKIARPLAEVSDQQHWLPRPNPLEVTGGISISDDTFQTYRDEFDPHLSTHMPLRNILNLFERSRSNWLGGPDGLRRLQEEDGLLFVVSSMGKLSLVDCQTTTWPGQPLTIETAFFVKRRGMVIECRHTAKLGKEPIAQGIVNIMTIDANTRRPTTNLPTWLAKKMGI